MKTAAIISEYNPFHAGHLRQFRLLREALGEDAAIICLMSGHFVQRGAPAVFLPALRAEAALRCGADLVLENPVTNVLRSAEGYAAGSVELLSALGGVDYLSFGCEDASAEQLLTLAALLDSEEFSAALRPQLDAGLSFAAARQRAVEALGGEGTILEKPNNILGVEYCKALLRQNSALRPLVVQRTGDYHEKVLQQQAPSATAVRAAMAAGERWLDAVPEAARAVQGTALRHDWIYAERAVAARLRTMPREEFAALPHGEEGLWSRMHRAVQEYASLAQILEATKSKRYAMTRVQRLLTCAYLGIDRQTLARKAPYVRVLGFTERGQSLLREMRRREGLMLLHAGERSPDASFAALEARVADLHALCSAGDAGFGAYREARVVRL